MEGRVRRLLVSYAPPGPSHRDRRVIDDIEERTQDMANDFAQGGVSAFLAAALDNLNRAAEIAQKISAHELAHRLRMEKDELSSLMPLVEKL